MFGTYCWLGVPKIQKVKIITPPNLDTVTLRKSCQLLYISFLDAIASNITLSNAGSKRSAKS